MAAVQHRYPAGDGEIQLPHREFVEHPAQDLVQGGPVKVDAAHGEDTAPVALFQLSGQRLCLRGVGAGAVEQDDERLAQRFQLLHHPLFGGKVIFPRDLADGSVGGDDDADGGVVPDDFAGSGLGGKVKGDLLVEPRAFDHAGLVVLLVAHSPLHHVTHAVDEPHGEGGAVRQTHLCGLLRYELWLGGHNGAAGAALGQFVPGPLPAVFVGDVGQDHGLHKPLDKGGLPRPGGPHHADVDVPRRALGDVLVNACQGIHSMSPPSGCF